MKYIPAALLALFFSSSIYAFHLQSATVANNTGTNIQIIYLICEGKNCDGTTQNLFMEKNEPSEFLVNLNSGQNVRVLFAEEIDYKNGYPLPISNGARGTFDGNCKANPGQILRLIQGTSPRAIGTIFCQVKQ